MKICRVVFIASLWCCGFFMYGAQADKAVGKNEHWLMKHSVYQISRHLNISTEKSAGLLHGFKQLHSSLLPELAHLIAAYLMPQEFNIPAVPGSATDSEKETTLPRMTGFALPTYDNILRTMSFYACKDLTNSQRCSSNRTVWAVGNGVQSIVTSQKYVQAQAFFGDGGRRKCFSGTEVILVGDNNSSEPYVCEAYIANWGTHGKDNHVGGTCVAGTVHPEQDSESCLFAQTVLDHMKSNKRVENTHSRIKKGKYNAQNKKFCKRLLSNCVS